MSQTKTISFNGFTFNIPVWSASETLSRISYFLPVIGQPITNVLAYGEDESMLMPAVVSGIITSLSDTNIPEFIQKALEGVSFFKGEEYGEFSKTKIASVKTMEEDGIDFATIGLVVASVVKVNFGPLSKGVSSENIEKIMSL